MRVSRATKPVTAAVLALCLGAAPPPGSQTVRPLHEAAGEPFKIRETDHFTIAYNTDYGVIRPLVGRLEATFDAAWRFAAENNLADKPPAQRLEVIVFDRLEEFRRYAERVGVTAGGMAGFYHPTTNVAAFCNMHNSPALANLGSEIDRIQRQHAALVSANQPATLTRRRQLRSALSNLAASRETLVTRFNRLVIQHEGAHQVLFNLGVHVRGAMNPDWLIEGLACQFEVPQGDRTGRIRTINQMRLGDFREALGLAANVRQITPEAHTKALAARRVIPLTDLVSGKGFAEQPAEDVAYRYAQAWSLVFHLSRRHGRSFERYLKRLTSRAPGEAVEPERELAEFESLFGKIGVAFETHWLTHMVGLRFDPHEAKR